MSSDTNGPWHPIIYVRGYAMTQGEIDQTTADPFCGFNLGSTVYRATPDKDKPAKKFVFESPVVRLGSDFDYSDVFDNGLDIMDPDWAGNPAWNGGIPRRSIIVYRYYEQASRLLGSGETPDIEEFAKGLSQLVIRVRDLVCRNHANEVTPKTFRCYLVAHSMGGLVCRAFLQNPALGKPEARACVEKVFTYATPHNGIDIVGINVPSWLSANDINNFNRKRMAGYLKLEKLYQETERVDWLPEEAFPSEKFFCMIGTNRGDYEAALGLSRAFAGHGSDGLVRIENASVWGVSKSGKISAPCATAYAYRSHSGYFGIVNSEEAYQSLIRFLFGDVRVDMWVEVTGVRLPADLEGKTVNALYQFEVLAAPRGKRWYLTRRTAEEDSAACRTYRELTDPKSKGRRSLYLSTIFLSKRARVRQDRPSLAYGVTLGVRVPDYEIERKFWPDGHYEGGYLFHDTVIVELIPPANEEADWAVRFDWQSDNRGPVSHSLDPKKLKGGKVELDVPFDSETTPGVTGLLRFIVSEWNIQ
ncbi:MAG: hypothetical protein NNA30_04620 [Nitrospira sp.]|nr:hypothetical protein [Nitrospira sp.]